MTAKVLIKIFLRTYFVAAAFNTKSMQSIGLSYAMEPGLKFLYPDKEQLQAARRRYLDFYNTHPFWTPMLVGVFLFMEREAIKGILPYKSMSSMRKGIITTLSAIGDSFIGGSLFILWSLTTLLFLVNDLHVFAFFWGLLWFTSFQIFKFYTFYLGLLYGGLSCIKYLRNWDLINAGQKIKMANFVALLLIWYSLLPVGEGWYFYFCCLLFFVGASQIIQRFVQMRDFFLLGVLLFFLFQNQIIKYLSLVLN